MSLLVAGLVHLDLYFGGYRNAGSVPSFGRSILLNAIVSAVVAAIVAVRREWFVRLAGIAVAAGTLMAFSYTHTEHTFLGFQGEGLDPSPQAQIVLIAEIATVILLAATFIPSIAATDTASGGPGLAVTGTIAAGAFVALGANLANAYDTTTEAAAPASVAIVDFAFAPEALTVESGTAVTWTNDDAFRHSIVAADGSFSSDSLDREATFRHMFDEAGHYAYVCGIHPQMSGAVTVTD
jgi:plastocyanin